MKKVLVTGAGGQLGQCFKKYAEEFPGMEFTFTTSDEIDLSIFGLVSAYFRKNEFDYCINCAAYTNVEQAETNREMAFLINSEAVKNLSEVCVENKVVLVHFSTDYVFDGEKNTPYSEEDKTNPLNVYGASKLYGEDHIQQNLEEYYIFRTSWLYSDIGHNFYNTILKKAIPGAVFNITTEQKGTPTNAYDLAHYVLTIISEGNKEYGLYHFSNLGEATWFDFAKEILNLSGKLKDVELNKDNSYRTVAVRPRYSVLNKEKAGKTFPEEILPWKESLARLYN
ncbi:NAD(P)-dependent oxidoreductase [Salinimicrobium marinum]|uniref:dTDP-4-dehydrorhamnose reductase n=1 Tax=Salinimicrobium marinum TaxID=680283 RepID=A0A918SHG5_9FLAO|nr:dTDP-4-dehydrorhamnose reductase [Salinimicrobium marinum]GHA38992.1 NAD(P)-dependent oxidoreductase [Salinimicrobium marinum]